MKTFKPIRIIKKKHVDEMFEFTAILLLYIIIIFLLKILFLFVLK